MQGHDGTVGQVLNASNAYQIPPYQRNYQWDTARWQSVVSDVIQAAVASSTDAFHWLGILLLSEDTEVRFPGDQSIQSYTVIDGQQRLVTLLVWLAALAHHSKDHQLPLTLDVSRLANVSVQESDRKPFEVAMSGEWRSPANNPLLQDRQSPLAAYYYFRWLLWLGEDALLEEEPVRVPPRRALPSGQSIEDQWTNYSHTKAGKELPRGNPVDPSGLINATQKRLTMYSLIHQPRIDESQAVIFDTLNGLRTELQPLDHVRNSLFVRMPSAEAHRLYESHWSPAEAGLRRVKTKRMYAEKLFLYDYLIARGEKKRQKTLNANRGAAAFAVVTKGLRDASLASFVTRDVLPAMTTWPAVVRQADEVDLDGVRTPLPVRALELMTSIQDLTENPANPAVLHYATAFVRGALAAQDLDSALFAVEAYLVRQLLGNRPQSPLRSKFMEIMSAVDRSTDLGELHRALRSSDWVADAEIKRVSREMEYYAVLSAGQLAAIFRGVERKRSGPGAMFFRFGPSASDYTMEHIYPQANRKWLSDLQTWHADVARMTKLTHTLGNLTVATTKHNNAVGNKTLIEKQRYPAEPGNAAPLSINSDWIRSRRWTQDDIVRRTDALVGDALAYWKLQ